MIRQVLGALVLALGSLLAMPNGPSFAQGADPAEKRVALVIGNSAYKEGGRLRNPVNDARAMRNVLASLGFKVTLLADASQKQMKTGIVEFGDQLRDTRGVGLFYYAGHGIQVAGRNYLVPVDATIRSERLVDVEAVDVNSVLGEMDGAKNRLNIVILDACRDNPFARSFRSVSRGLAAIDAPSGTFIAYATAPGSVAADGEGANGLYTGELVRAIHEPGLPLESVFKRVTQAVRRQSGGRQVPWVASSLEGDFIFSAPGAAPRVAAVPAPSPPKLEVREEIRQEFGTVSMRSSVPGVEVWLGDQRIGTTREGVALIVSNVLVGSRQLTARKQGYREWTREVQVAANQRADVVIDIEPLRTEPAKTAKGDDGAEMVLVPAGEFWMGSDPAEIQRAKEECKKSGVSEPTCNDYLDREGPRHRVTLDAFYIDRHEVTNALFERFASATGHRTTAEREGSGRALQEKDGKWQFVTVNGASWRHPNGPGSSAPSNHPAVQVSWEDATAYCRWAGKRLPTEAEWEKAARGTDGRRYPWGGDWDSAKANGDMTVKTTKAVGSYPGGASPYGLHDMAGNAAEWVADWYDAGYYQRSPERNPQGPDSGQYRVLRGGSWHNYLIYLRASFRYYYSPDFRDLNFGFRCARGLL